MSANYPPTHALSPEERTRSEEVDRLAATGPEGVAALVDMLDDPSWTVRRGVVAALGAVGDPAIGPLCDVLRFRRDDEARIAAAVDALVASVGAVEEQVITLAEDPNPAVAADAAQVLGRRRSGTAVAKLRELLEHRDDNVAVAAIEALGRVGGRAAVESLVAAVGSGNFFRVFPAIDVLGRSGDPRAVRPLATLVDDPYYGFEAVRALGRTGEKAAVAPLAALLAKPGDANVRLAAAALAELSDRYLDRYGASTPIEQALGETAPRPQSARRLIASLADAEVAEQRAIAWLLGVIGGDGAVPALTKLLDAAPPVATAAAGALKRLGRESDAQLLDALRGGDSARRRVLLPLVSRSSGTDEVVRCLSDPDPAVRALACDALARIGNPRVVNDLFPLLADENVRVVQSAVAAIQSLGDPATERLALEAARSSRPTVRREALRILAYFGYGAALQVFLDSLSDPDPRVREAAIQGLAFLEEPGALDALLAAARDASPRTRAIAMRALGQSNNDLRVTSYLLKGLSDLDAWVRYYAAQALGKLGAELAARPIAALLDDEAGQVRVAAVDALSHLESDLAQEALRRAARSENADVCRAALIGLGIGKRPESMPLLLEAARSADPATRLVAVSGLVEFPGPDVLPALALAARDPDESVRTAALGFLAARPGADATAVLIGLLVDPLAAPLVQPALALPVDGRVEGISSALAAADDELAPRLTSALARMHAPQATDAIFAALSLPNPAARKAAATTLAAVGTRDAVTALKKASSSDPDPEVRRVAALLLAQ